MSKPKLKDMTLPEIFDSGGLLSQIIPGYTPRQPQIDAVETIQRAYDNSTHALIEAGTGTGKSYIVLLGGAYWSSKHGKKVVISLPSQILQEQLFKSDVPSVMKMLEGVQENVKFALAIGRGNFLCLRKVTNLFQKVKEQLKSKGKQTILTQEELVQFKSITESLNKEDIIGYKGDVDFVPEDSLWAKVQSASDSCLADKCPFYNQCFYFKNKKNIEEADVVISNNALLFADMSQKMNIGFDQPATLPPYNLLIFDESHNLESDATNFFKVAISSEELLNSVVDVVKNEAIKELLSLEENEKLRKITETIKTVLSATGNYLFPFIDREQRMKLSRSNKDPDTDTSNAEIVLSSANLENMKRYFEAIRYAFNEYGKFMNNLDKKLKKIENPKSNQVLIYKRILSIKSRVESVVNKCQNVFADYNPESLYFLQKKYAENYQKLDKLPVWTITKTPINLGEIFQKNMFSVCNHVILLSATISTNGNFDFFRSRLGFKPTDKVEECIVSSPFDYPKQGKVYLCENSPDTNKVEEFTRFTAKVTYEILSKTSGGTFILFTSNNSMKKVYELVADKIERDLNIKCLMQGQDSKSMIIKKFREYQRPGSGYKSAILFAGKSFWEGVSVEGRDLMNVIVTKLPFPQPTEPVFKARCEYLNSKGINSFNEYVIPLATIPLKQGFGRLIRTKDDRGNIFMLDNRLVKAGYKDKIIKSLPEFQYIKLNM